MFGLIATNLFIYLHPPNRNRLASITNGEVAQMVRASDS